MKEEEEAQSIQENNEEEKGWNLLQKIFQPFSFALHYIIVVILFIRDARKIIKEVFRSTYEKTIRR